MAIQFVKHQHTPTTAQACQPSACVQAPEASPVASPVVSKPKRHRSNANTRPLPVGTVDLNQSARLRVGHLLTLFGIASPTFYAKKKAGEIPKQDGWDGRPFWYVETIRPLITKGEQ